MKLNKKMATGLAAAGAVAALSLATAGAATASPAGHPKHHKPKPPAVPQVSGNRLSGALLPASAFGDHVIRDHLFTTGSSLRSTKATATPGSQSCRQFENYFTTNSGYGNTAGADASEFNTNPDFSAYPATLLSADQEVLQFGSTKAAATVFGQMYAKYGACSDLTETFSDGSTEELTNQSLGKTTLGKYQAFTLIQTDTLSGLPTSNPFYLSTSVVLAGTNIYLIDESTGTNDPVPSALMSKLISQTQALYPKH